MSGLASDAGATAAGYVIGSIPFGLLLGRATRGLDVRETGSGSMGSTNVLRVAGPAAAGATFALDVGKGTAAVMCARAMGAGSGGQVAAGLAAMVGHSWPVFAGFRGGKSVATAFGALLAISPEVSAYAVAGGVDRAGVDAHRLGGFAGRGGRRRPLEPGVATRARRPARAARVRRAGHRSDRDPPHRQPAPAGPRARAARQPAATRSLTADVAVLSRHADGGRQIGRVSSAMRRPRQHRLTGSVRRLLGAAILAGVAAALAVTSAAGPAAAAGLGVNLNLGALGTISLNLPTSLPVTVPTRPRSVRPPHPACPVASLPSVCPPNCAASGPGGGRDARSVRRPAGGRVGLDRACRRRRWARRHRRPGLPLAARPRRPPRWASRTRSPASPSRHRRRWNR